MTARMKIRKEIALISVLIGSALLSSCSTPNAYRAKQHLDKAKAEYKLNNNDKSLAEVSKSIELNSSTNDDAYYHRAILMIGSGKEIDALQDLEKAKKSYFEDALYQFRLGLAQGRSKDYRKAISSYSKSIRLDPEGIPSAYYNRGIAYKTIGDKKNAKLDFGEYIKRVPKDPDGWIERAVISFDTDKLDDSLSDLDAAIDRDKAAKRAYFLKGLILNQKRDHDGAASALIAFSRFEENAYVYRLIGSAYAELQNHEKALAYYDKSLALEPDNAEARYARSTLFLVKKNLKAAERDVSEAIRLSPSNGSYYLQKGNILLAKGDNTGAEVLLKRGAELNGSLAEYYYLKGRRLTDSGDLRGARHYYEKAVDEDPRSVKMLNSLGVSYSRLDGDNKKAADLYTRALKIAPGDWVVYVNRCDARMRLKDFKGAIDDCNRAKQLNPNLDSIYSKRGRSYLGLGKLSAAESEFTLAIKANPVAPLYVQRAITRFRAGKVKKAILDLNVAITKHPDDANYYSLRGIYYEQLDDLESACSDWWRAAELGDDDSQEWLDEQCVEEEIPEIALG